MNQADQKIIPLHPEFVREVSDTVEKAWDLTGQSESEGNELWSPELRAFLDGSTLKSLFFTEDWVFIVCDLIASKISAQPLRVMKSVVEGETESFEPVPDHPLNALFEQPNEWQDYAQWMYNTVVEDTLGGNAVIWHAPRAGQLITFPFDTISMDFDDRRRVSSYVVNDVMQTLAGRQVVGQNYFDPKTIVHIRRPNPSSLLWGLSPFVPGRKSVLFNRYSSDYLNAFYLKQATPGLALSLERTVNEDVALRQLRSFEVAYQGRKNQRRTLILPKGVTATTLTHTLSDQKLIDHIKLNRETICGLLKVPKHELGLQEAGSLGSEEYKIALRNFWEATLIPTQRRIEGALTKFFQKELGPDMFVQFDNSGVEALKDDLKKKAETAKEMLAAGLTVNEVRQQVWQQEASDDPNADKPFVLIKPAQQTFGSSAPAPTQDAAAPEAVKLLAPAAKITMTPEIEAFRSRTVKQLLDEEARTVEELAKTAVDMLVGMTETAIDVLQAEDKAAQVSFTKALPPRRTLSRRIDKALADKFEEEWQTEVARTLSSSVDLGYDQQLELVLNEKDRRALEVLRARDKDKRRSTLNARGLDSFANISASHTERIMAQVTEGTKRGESIGTIMQRVANALGTPKQLTGRAETIARTETLTAVSIGQAAALANAVEVFPKGMKKVWLSAGDDRVRDSHRALDGDTIDVDQKFDNGLRHPRDVEAADAAEVINCRCTLLMLPPGETVELP